MSGVGCGDRLDPRVVAVMLTRDRPEMAARAIASFHAQTYENKRLLVLDTTPARQVTVSVTARDGDVTAMFAPQMSSYKVGDLRNHANDMAADLGADLICHWDSDDWSHPRRIAEQVKLLQETRADAVGYREGVFWDTRERPVQRLVGGVPAIPIHAGTGQLCRGMELQIGGAWLYSAPVLSGNAIGASLMYTVAAWRKWPFLPDTSQGEEHRLITECSGEWVSSVSTRQGEEPRMIYGIHGGNTSQAYDLERMRQDDQWTRVPQMDAVCAERMRL